MAKKEAPFNNPLVAGMQALKQELAQKAEAEAAAKKPKVAAKPLRPKAEPSGLDDASLFLYAMQGARPIADKGRVTPPKAPPAGPPTLDEDVEAYTELASLVEGGAEFDIAETDDFIEGTARGLDRRVLLRLKRGEVPVQAALDLHGMTRDAAKRAVEQFLGEQQRLNKRCVRIVHGRGLHSKDEIPVLKLALRTWLERGKVAKSVLCFCSARPADGGLGAVYVLLRKPLAPPPSR